MSRTYKNFDKWPTQKLLEIIDHPYNQGIDGHDYGPVIEEIQQEYWRRMNKTEQKEYEKRIKNYNKGGI